MKKWPLFILVILTGCLLASCQKELTYKNVGGGIVPPVAQKPKQGTEWMYYYYTFYSYGGVATIEILIYKAKTEETLGGEKWLRIVDVAMDTTVYLLREKADGLYQYANNSSSLFCKFPALVNDTYNSFNGGSPETFIVKGAKDTLPTGIGDIPANYYHGIKSSKLTDEIWYNENAWIVRRATYKAKGALNPVFFRNSIMYIGTIVY